MGFSSFAPRSLHPAHQLHCPSTVKEIVKTLFALQQMEERRGSNSSTAAALRKRIPGHILAHYDTQRARGRRAVAIAHNDICGECHLKIPVAVEKALLVGADLQICTNCGRYLMLASEAHSAAKTPAA
jgi:predicted  nucleic acid-binding Zn-ribbon protein